VRRPKAFVYQFSKVARLETGVLKADDALFGIHQGLEMPDKTIILNELEDSVEAFRR
jgi:hypothetical protein